jgi:ATPase subunit of ABC transporter with duplicated ATPase domains
VKPVQRKAEILRRLNRYFELLRFYREELEHTKYEDRQKTYQDEIKKLEEFIRKDGTQGTKKEQAPFSQIKRIASMKPNYPRPGSGMQFDFQIN